MNPLFLHRVGKLLPYTASQPSTTPGLAFSYHFEPPIEQDNQLGSLYIVIEVLAKDSLASQVVDMVIRTIGEEYYNKKYTAEAENRFEKAIAVLNKQITQLKASHHGKQLSDIHAVIAVINQSELYLTSCGKAHARLYRKKSIIDLASGLFDSKNQAKVFQGVAEGSLHEADKLFFATPAVMFEFETNTLNSIIQDNSPTSTAQKLKALLKNDQNAARCAALAVELTNWDSAADQPLEHEPETAMVGKPKTKIDSLKGALAPTASKAAGSLKTTLGRGHHWVKHSLAPSVKDKSKNFWNKLWTNHINPNPKRALIIALTIIAVVIGGYMFASSNNYNRKNLVTSYKEAIALTESAEAQLSLGKSEPSQASVAAAKTKVAYIRKEFTPAQIARVKKDDTYLASKQAASLDNLNQRLSDIEDKLNNITRLKPDVVVDFSSISGFKANFITQIDDRLYSVDTNSGSLYQVDTAKKSYTQVAKDSSLKKAIAATASSSGSTLYILTSEPSVWQYSPGKSLKQVQLSAGDWSNGNAIASYIGNLYILSSENNQIYRHSPTSVGFSASSSYIKRSNDVSISSATGIAVNGSILVANASRDLKLFSNGIGESMAVSKLPRSIAGLTLLALGNNDTLYALTNSKQGIVSLDIGDDTPKFTKEFALPSSTKTTSFIVKDNTAYLLSGQRILTSKLQ